MPWREVGPMDAKRELVQAALRREESMEVLCARAGVSPTAGDNLLARFLREGEAAYQERSRAPHTIPWAVPRVQQEVILALRDRRPRWGPKKLRASLCEQAPEQRWLAPSAIGDLLKREGRIKACRRRRHAQPTPSALTVAVKPNVVWCIDFGVSTSRAGGAPWMECAVTR